MPDSHPTPSAPPAPRVYLKEYGGIRVGDFVLATMGAMTLGGTAFCFVQAEKDKPPQVVVMFKAGFHETLAFDKVRPALRPEVQAAAGPAL